MTEITALFLRPSAAGPIPARGDVTFLPTRRRVVGGDTIGTVLPTPFTVAPDSQGEATFALEPTTVFWVWKAVERFENRPPVIRHVVVPDDAEGMDYSALVEVDPTTLLNPVEPDPVWYAYTDLLKTEATAAKNNAAGSKTAAEAAQAAATTSQTSAAASATTATTKASEASASAAAASGSAATASTKAAEAGASATSASGSATSATASATTATTKAGEASASAAAAAASKTGADAARDTAVAHATGFSAGIVTSLSHLAAPTAAVTGTAPALKLDLGIPRGVPTAITIGEVETGPETPGIVGPQGPTGPQGPAGGFANFASMGNVNLDTMVTNGIYKQTNGAYVTAGNNYPCTGGIGTLTVENAFDDTSRLEQTFHRITSDMNQTSRIFWKRTKYDTSGWSAWRSFPSKRIDQTAGRAIYMWDELNFRDQLIWGDTGLRDISADSGWISALTGTGVTLANNLIKVRRVGSVVDLSWVVDKPASGNVTCSTAFPTGFRPAGIWNAIGINSSIGLIRAYSAGGANSMIYQSNAAGMNTTHNIVYTTTDAWPTTLPGTASGSIPNL